MKLKKDAFKPSLVGKVVTISNWKWPEDVWVGVLNRMPDSDDQKVWYRVEKNPEAGEGKGKTHSFSFTGPTVREINGTRIITG